MWNGVSLQGHHTLTLLPYCGIMSVGWWNMSLTRAEKAGRLMGRAIVESIHLMYQNNTAAHYLRGLISVLETEVKRRKRKNA